MKIHNPYIAAATVWRKCNFHAHSTQSDGQRSPQELIDTYSTLGYDVLAISDHDRITDTRRNNAQGMTLIPANEITINGPHVLHVGAKAVVPPRADRQAVLNAIRGDGGIAIMNHPNWERHFNHCPQEKLEAWQSYLGVEIYNGLVRSHEGNPLATDKWDMLLGKGRRVWGFANDDAHYAGDEGIAWNMVQSDTVDAESILAALVAGRFYATTGVTIETIRVSGNTIEVAAGNAQRIIVSADFGKRIMQVDAPHVSYTVPEDTTLSYVRFECVGSAESMAWTQPFHIERQ